MSSNTRTETYRIESISPWASDGSAGVPEGLRTFFEGQEVTMDDIRALALSFGADFESAVEGAARYQATIRWRGHRYDLELQPVRQ